MLKQKQLIKNSPWMNESDLKDIGQASKFLKGDPGVKPFEYGKPVKNYYVVLKGTVGVFVPNYSLFDDWHKQRKRFNDLKKWKILAFDLKVMTVKRMKFKEWEAKKAARDKKIEEDRISGSDESWAKNLIKDYEEIGAEIKEEEVEIPEEFVFD